MAMRQTSQLKERIQGWKRRNTRDNLCEYWNHKKHARSRAGTSNSKPGVTMVKDHREWLQQGGATVLCGLTAWYQKSGFLERREEWSGRSKGGQRGPSAPPPRVCGRKQPPTERAQGKLRLCHLLFKKSSFQTPKDEIHRNTAWTTESSSVPACYGLNVCDSSPCPTLPINVLKPLTHSVTVAGDRTPKEVTNGKRDRKSGALIQQG